jgi:uncharacterized SAM-binding protein YcdF (DUF218 family)
MSLASLPTLLIVPPLNLLVAAAIGASFGRKRWGRGLVAFALGGLVLLSLPIVSGSLIALLEIGLDRPPPPGPPPQAIVILSADQQPAWVGAAVTYTVGPFTLEREQAGALLARRTSLPVLVSGGALHPWSPPLANLMAESLHQDFATEVRWREAQSIDTWENAQESAAMLHLSGISRVWLVTHAWHMPRALLAFRRAGLQPVPAPVRIDAVPEFRAASFVPSVAGWVESYLALHEMIGLAWYHLTS